MRAYFTIVVAASTAACCSFAHAQPSIAELPGFVTGVSGNGAVVTGRVGALDAAFHAYRWTRAGGVESLGTLGGTASMGLALDFDGSTVTGWSRVASGLQNAFVWSSANGLVALEPGDSPGSYGNAINADGSTVVGSYRPLADPFSQRAALWDSTGSLHDLGTLGGEWSYATAVSADGTSIVGVHHVAGQHPSYGRSFIWSAATGMVDLHSSGSSRAWSMSADGSVVAGHAYTGLGTGIYRWTSDSGMRELVWDDVDPTEYEIFHDGLTMSGDGRVMGGIGVDFTLPPTPNDARAWLWTEHAGFTLLEPYLTSLGVDLAGWELHQVTGLSFDGSTIVGLGMFEGESRSWIVSGVPSPGGLALMALCGVISARRRRVK